MNQRNYYLLSIDLEQNYDADKLLEKLNKALDWIRIVPGTYFIVSISDYRHLYIRFKDALPNNRFFIAKLDVGKGEYTGWLPREKWQWIKKNIK